MEKLDSCDALAETVKAHHAQREKEIAEERAANGGKLKKHVFQERACITYWYPKLLSAPVKMPETKILRPDVDLFELCAILDGPRCPPEIVEKFDALVMDLEHQIKRLGGRPVFLRTGTTSGKHTWKDTCFISETTNLRRNLANLIEDAAIKDQCLDVFVVREMLPTTPVFHAFYGQMPIVKERRFFARDGKILGDIPYWPEGAFEGHETSVEDWRPLVHQISSLSPAEREILEDGTRYAAWALDGEWSIDWLLTDKGWYLTDCAPARMSYGWDLLPAEVRG